MTLLEQATKDLENAAFEFALAGQRQNSIQEAQKDIEEKRKKLHAAALAFDSAYYATAYAASLPK